MSNETTRIFVPDGNNDALTTALLANNGGMGGFGGFAWVVLLLATLRNGGLLGNEGGNGYHSQLSQIQDTLNTNQGNTLIMDAVKGNATAIGQLSQTIGCNQNALINALNAIQSAICNYANQTGMSIAQVVNQITNGNMQVINTLQSCCCDVKQLVTTQGYENRIENLKQSQLIQNGFAQIGYANAEQTCSIKQNATDNTSRVLAKLDAIEDSRKDREIASLTAALTAANSRAERQSELAPIYKALADIECKQPNTVTIPYSPVTPVPSCVAWNAALYGGFPYGSQRGNVFS